MYLLRDACTKPHPVSLVYESAYIDPDSPEAINASVYREKSVDVTQLLHFKCDFLQIKFGLLAQVAVSLVEHSQDH